MSSSQVLICLVKAALFGVSTGLTAWYKGIFVGGGLAGVGNAVNETVVYTLMTLFAINVVATGAQPNNSTLQHNRARR